MLKKIVTMNKRKIRRMLILLAFVGAISFSYYRLDAAFDSYFEAQLETQLPRVRTLYGININYCNVDFDFFSGPSISDVVITKSNAGEDLFVLKIPKVAIDYAVNFRQRFRVSLRGIELHHPSIILTADSSTIEDRVKTFIDGADEASAHEGGAAVELPPVMHVRWMGGNTSIIFKKEGAKPLELKISAVEGFVKYNPDEKRLVAESIADVGGGTFGILVSKGKEGKEFSFSLKQFDLKRVSEYLPDFIMTNGKTCLTAKAKMKSANDIVAKPINLEIAVENLEFNDDSVSNRPIKGLDLNVEGDLVWNFKHKEVDVDRLIIGIKKLALNVTGIVDYNEKPKIDGVVSIKEGSIQTILDSLPSDFIPKIEGAKVAGSLDFEMEFSLDFNNLSSFKIEPRIDIKDYKLLKPPKDVDLDKLHGTFTHIAKINGDSKNITVGRSSSKFVPFSKLGEYTIKGVLTCEDGSFFYHNGFQLKHIRESIIQNIRDQQFTRGASTITMQLAKNLFLSGKKNLSRKFQEILIAYALEQEFDKKRLFEIYMNIIEWGPGLYGIGPAAKYYFAKDPDELTPLEAAYLGSIIASPRRYHYMYKNGHVTDQWATYLSVILNKMNLMGEDYDEALSSELEFGWVRKEREAQEALEEKAANNNDNNNPDLENTN